MEATKLRRFAQYTRRTLLELVAAHLQLVLQPDSAARRESPKAVKDLEEQIHDSSREQVIDRVAYTCALRYMDVNRVNRISVVSPLDGQFQPEILAEAKMGHIDEEMVSTAIQARVRALLDGTAPSPDPQQEAYRLLVVAVCNYWQRAMPFLFEAIADYTELLMPDDLLSGNSILSYAREAMTPDACQDVEVIGWLYQFYISEKKDAVFEGLKKKNKKITPENIPPATQLFTPHWIVRYLVENSLGRLWLLNRPNSRLAEKMEYYIAPQEAETDFLRIAKPEDIKLCDPACGSGHMLTYAFDLLYAIYEEEGTDPSEIPEKILTHNLYGIEIDERAAELAAFALTMKALQYDKRFFRRATQSLGRDKCRPAEPNICVLRPIRIEPHVLDAYVAEVGRDLFTANLLTLLTQFEEADNFGSLIRPVTMDYAELHRVLAEKGIGNQLLLEHVHKDVLRVLEQAEYLSQRYQVVVANPPYMGGKGMNGRMAAWIKNNYPDVKSDLFSAFMVRNTELALPKGQLGFMSPFVWMFISSYEKLRQFLITQKTITSLVQLEHSGFDGATVPICTFIIENFHKPNFHGGYVRLSDFRGSENQAPRTLEAIRNPNCGWFYRAASAEFHKIPRSPIAYWVTEKIRDLFSHRKLSQLGNARQGLATANNGRFVRNWQEVSLNNVGLGLANEFESKKSARKWFPYNKGGEKRRWYGNQEFLVDWENGGEHIKSFENAVVRNPEYYFRESISWGLITSGGSSFRYYPIGFVYDVGGMSYFSDNDLLSTLGMLNTKLYSTLTKVLNPTVNLQIGDISLLPYSVTTSIRDAVNNLTKRCIDIAKQDWDALERSWEFSSLKLLASKTSSLEISYSGLCLYWQSIVSEMKSLEQENNRIFIDAYGLQDELTPDVPLNEITLTCNPYYRYGGNKTEAEVEDLLRVDTMREFISYAVGCMFGRYSLDQPGLVLANQGETLGDYLRQVPQPRFMPDEDNVIPLLGGDWFTDDITGRFREFLHVTFGDEHYEENLRFIETALGKKDKPLPIRDYFLKEFYADHVKRYKKRPIYWLFSSPKSTFNALIYVHRYRPDTASIVLQYLRDFRSKLVSERDHQAQMSISDSANQGEKTKALKKIEELRKTLVELDDYERETLYPLATQQVTLDLDDGVKVNYLKLGDALKRIAGLEVAEE